DTTTDVARAIKGADVVVVVLPATAHSSIAAELARSLEPDAPVLLNPGHMCGSLHFRRTVAQHGGSVPTVAELGTLTYVCRSSEEGSVDVHLRTTNVPLAIIPGDNEATDAAVRALFPDVRIAHPVEVWLHDVNMVLHPPGMILAAAWIESTGGAFRFYSEGVTPAVASVMESLDSERREVGRAFGFKLRELGPTMAGFGTAEAEAAQRGDLRSAVTLGQANQTIRAPSSLDHRYLSEDIPFGLVPFTTLARAAGVATPTADALIELAQVIAKQDLCASGLNASRLGIVGLDASGIMEVAAG
ncbi:MAG: NAD/NADP octopine/nopaline dehydrogenase family protein, partial [Actinomycetota bacterium]|nr:NAD/NADP octopine/nopaline dehydrogenase family protein [Actinomycetota bacterium]